MSRLPVIGSFLVVMSFFGLCATSPALAVDMGFAGNGEAIALEICSDCHVVSDRQMRVGLVALPTFREVANDPMRTEGWFRAFMRTPHNQMPNFMFSDDQLHDLSAYIRTLKD